MTRTLSDLESRIAAERARRLNGATGIGTWRYWAARGDATPPPEEYWCGHCAGWYGVPHDDMHKPGQLCRNLDRPWQCADIDCWVASGRSEVQPAWRPQRLPKLTVPQDRTLRAVRSGHVVIAASGTPYDAARAFPNHLRRAPLRRLIDLGLVEQLPADSPGGDRDCVLTAAGRAALGQPNPEGITP